MPIATPTVTQLAVIAAISAVGGAANSIAGGGTLLTFAEAGDLPMQRFGLPVRNVVADIPSKEFWAPGSTLRHRPSGRSRQAVAV